MIINTVREKREKRETCFRAALWRIPLAGKTKAIFGLVSSALGSRDSDLDHQLGLPC
jgi:hypothetical protein